MKIRGPRHAIGWFADPKDGQLVWIIPKARESGGDAVDRVTKHHRVQRSVVTFGRNAEQATNKPK
jgi:hypothetical protein